MLQDKAYRFLMGFFNKEMNGKCMKMLKHILSREQIDVLFDNDIPFMKRLIDLFAGIDNNFYKGNDSQHKKSKTK